MGHKNPFRMRLSCTVQRRDRQLASMAMLSKKASTSVLSIGTKSGGGDVAILHHTITTKENASYKVKGNILKVFTKFIEEGKATISFAAPPHDLMIQAGDKIQLKAFLNSIRLVLQGKELSRGAGGLSSLDSTVKVTRPKIKLVVTNRADYPVLEGFPRTLRHLQITGIERTKFDNRILLLNQLHILDLSDNRLTLIPRGLGDLPNLSELCLSNNSLGSRSTEPGAWDWLRGLRLPSCLHKLDLSSNNISVLPSFLRECTALAILKLDSNQLNVLPSGIGKMQSLRYLSAANNKLKFLPGSMTLKHIDHLDVSQNPFTGDCITTSIVTLKTLSLKELAARCVIAYKIPVSEAVIPWTVLRFMQGCDFCACGSACFNPAHSTIIHSNLRKIAGTVILGPGDSASVPFRMSRCVDRCLRSKFAELISS